ncbi:LRR receptor-like serine/threonine-protein kinase EFR [Dorcoceras hygrometricum]|uniref:LRR receptor-like serine/threonine-protein kinase EFR n=1 Tax=Dorcoceras hygrometricum TaxID=472368 RepID=A0A2Z7B4T4_9LAMI|nr:LRR receptor-like serine/threonine-protein kinase EFR [Dorcoceras hygrometricum]
MRIRPPEFETGICDAKYHVSLSTRSVLGKGVYLVTLAMSLFDLQDVCIAIGSIATLDLPMVVDLIGIYGLKGPYSSPPPPGARRRHRLRFAGIRSGQFDEENPSAQISSGLLVQADEGIPPPVVDLIGVIYRNLP